MKSDLTQPTIYGLPAWPLVMLGIPLYIYLPTYYYQLGVELALVGLMLLLARVTDVVSDPLIGGLRDRLGQRGRYGLILLGWLMLIVGLWQLLLPTQASGLHLLIWAMWVYLAWTLIMIPYQALSAEVSEHYHVKTHFTAAREAFSIIGVVTVLVMPFVLANPQDYRALFELLYPLLALALTVTLGLMLWRLKRLPESLSHTKPKIFNHQAWWALWRDADSRTLLPAYFLNSLANAFPATLFLLFVQYFLQQPDATGLLLMTFFLAGVLGLPFWVMLSKKIGKYQSWRLSILLACLSFIWVFTLDSGDVWAFALISFLSGLSVGADVALPSSIQADIAQDMSRKNGAMSGLLFGVWGMLTKLALALAVGLAFPILDWSGWEARTETSLSMLVWLYAGVPIAIKLLVLLWLRGAR